MVAAARHAKCRRGWRWWEWGDLLSAPSLFAETPCPAPGPTPPHLLRLWRELPGQTLSPQLHGFCHTASDTFCSAEHLSGAETRGRGKQNRSSWRRDRLQGKVFRVAGSLQSRAGFCDEDLMRPKLLDSVFGVRGVIHHCWRSPWLVTAL